MVFEFNGKNSYFEISIINQLGSISRLQIDSKFWQFDGNVKSHNFYSMIEQRNKAQIEKIISLRNITIAAKLFLYYLSSGLKARLSAVVIDDHFEDSVIAINWKRVQPPHR